MAPASMLGHEMTAGGMRRALGRAEAWGRQKRRVLAVGTALLGVPVVLLALSYVARRRLPGTPG